MQGVVVTRAPSFLALPLMARLLLRKTNDTSLPANREAQS